LSLLFEKYWQAYERPVGDSWRVDETYLKVGGQWMYLYRAVEKQGKTVESYLSRTRDVTAAKASSVGVRQAGEGVKRWARTGCEISVSNRQISVPVGLCGRRPSMTSTLSSASIRRNLFLLRNKGNNGLRKTRKNWLESLADMPGLHDVWQS
jgi:DDE domain